MWLWLVSACVCVELAFTGIRSWHFQHFGFGRITQNFLKGASRRSGRLDVQPKKLFGTEPQKKGGHFCDVSTFSDF